MSNYWQLMQVPTVRPIHIDLFTSLISDLPKFQHDSNYLSRRLICQRRPLNIHHQFHGHSLQIWEMARPRSSRCPNNMDTGRDNIHSVSLSFFFPLILNNNNPHSPITAKHSAPTQLNPALNAPHPQQAQHRLYQT